MRSWGRFAVAALALGSGMGCASLARAQVMSTVVEEAERSGFGLYDVMVFGTYSNARTPVISPTGTLLSDYSFHNYSTGISTAVGWRSPSSKKWHLNLIFTPSYFYSISSTGFSAHRFFPRQTLNLSWSTPLSTRWTLTANLSANGGQYNQLLLLSNPDQALVGAPGTLGSLATAVSSNTTSGASQAILTGQQNLLYGGELITATAGVSLSYAATDRLTLSETTSGSRTQRLGNGGGPQQVSLLNQSTNIDETVTADYRLTERTNIFANLGYSRTISTLYVTPWLNANVGVSRSVTQHLFVNASAGAGYFLPSGQGPTYTSFHRQGWQGSFHAGYRFYRQSLVAGISRNVADNYGLGASGTMLVSGAWHWSPLGSAWGVTLGVSEIRFQETQFARQGFHVNAGVARTLGSYLFTSLTYGYGEGSGVASLVNPLAAHTHTQSVSLSFGFHPYLGKPDPGGFPGLPGIPGGQTIPGTQVGP